MALPQALRDQIKLLLQEKALSKRAISRKLGVSRVTIDRIARELLHPGEKKPPEIKIVHFNEGDDKLSEENRPVYERCQGCRGMQQKGVPCLVCATRKRMMKEYDCYIDDLLKPKIVSPLSSKYRKSTRQGGP